MRYFVGVFRLAIAFCGFVGTFEAWWLGESSMWVYFTFQTNFVLALVMVWAGAATLLKGTQPPAWLKGCLTLYIAITGLVAWFILPPSDPAYTPLVFGLLVTDFSHIIVPITAVADFLLFDEHRRFHWHYAFSWLIYFPLYLVFVLIRAAIWPHSGPGGGGNPYPYEFIDPSAIGWQQLGINIVVYMLAFLVAAALLVLIDRVLPKRAPLTV